VRGIILATNILILNWRQCRGGSLADRTAADAEEWARRLIKLQKTNAILTPIYLEFVGGVIHQHEMELSKAYLGQFRILDEGEITPADWALARQLAERIPSRTDPTPRGAIDCLIRALARRFRCDLRTSDLGMPR
jgi:hypothetical protein